MTTCVSPNFFIKLALVDASCPLIRDSDAADRRMGASQLFSPSDIVGATSFFSLTNKTRHPRGCYTPSSFHSDSLSPPSNDQFQGFHFIGLALTLSICISMFFIVLFITICMLNIECLLSFILNSVALKLEALSAVWGYAVLWDPTGLENVFGVWSQ
jgi:hypothetical protein